MISEDNMEVDRLQHTSTAHCPTEANLHRSTFESTLIIRLFCTTGHIWWPFSFIPALAPHESQSQRHHCLFVSHSTPQQQQPERRLKPLWLHLHHWTQEIDFNQVIKQIRSSLCCLIFTPQRRRPRRLSWWTGPITACGPVYVDNTFHFCCIQHRRRTLYWFLLWGFEIWFKIFPSFFEAK